MDSSQYRPQPVRCNRPRCGYRGLPERYHGFLQCPRCSTTDVTSEEQNTSENSVKKAETLTKKPQEMAIVFIGANK